MTLALLRTRFLATADRFRWIGPLALRLSLGAVFIKSGWGKLHDLDSLTKYFGELGIPFPGFNAALSSTTELVGGTLLFLGLLTRLAAIPLSVVMSVAILTARRPDIDGPLTLLSFIEVTYLSGFLWLLLAGPGKVSLDALLFGRHAPAQRAAPPAG